jgi:hypothetical protein
MPVARLVTLALAGGLALVLGAAPALAADPEVVLRPTTAGKYAYTAPEAPPYVGAHVVVHYVTSGLDAPPLQDDDASGSPDYIEQASLAADTAFAYYERQGFKRPAPDTAGPDTKPDVYIKSLPAGVLGLTFTPRYAEGGTFVLISPRLETGQTRPLGSLRMAVAHEFFHVVQFSYIVSGKVPLWAVEGSATAVSMLVFPQIEDLAMKDYLDVWLRKPWLPLYDERFNCVRCYGGAWWWLHLSRLNRRILPLYFAQLQADDRRGRPTRVGVKQLDVALRRSGAGSLYSVFTSFALNLYRRGLPVGDAYSLRASTTPRATTIRSVFGLSSHYVPIHVSPRARGVVIAVPYGDGPRPQVTLIVGGPKGRRVRGKQFRPGKGLIISTLFRNRAERTRIILIVTSGRLNGVRYQVGYAAVGRRGKLPGWIAFRKA